MGRSRRRRRWRRVSRVFLPRHNNRPAPGGWQRHRATVWPHLGHVIRPGQSARSRIPSPPPPTFSPQFLARASTPVSPRRAISCDRHARCDSCPSRSPYPRVARLVRCRRCRPVRTSLQHSFFFNTLFFVRMVTEFSAVNVARTTPNVFCFAGPHALPIERSNKVCGFPPQRADPRLDGHECWSFRAKT